MEDVRQSMKDLVLSPYDIEINMETIRLFLVMAGIIILAAFAGLWIC